MLKIGFSTGCLHKTGVHLDQSVGLLAMTGAKAIEVSFSTEKELMETVLSPETLKRIPQFSFVTIHSPRKEIRYGKNIATQKVLDTLRWMHEQYNAQGIVIHPDIVDDFDILTNAGLPFLFENMDHRKGFGTLPEHIEELKNRANFKFVLDVQHAYEIDPMMQVAKELLHVMGGRLHHLHVSGQGAQGNHVPTYLADNRKEITGILRLTQEHEIPKILEGVLLGDSDSVARSELQYVRGLE